MFDFPLRASAADVFQTVLGIVGKSTKAALGRVGVFSVTSLHAHVCARSPLTSAGLYCQGRRRGLLSTFKADSMTRIRPRSPNTFISQTSGYDTVTASLEIQAAQTLVKLYFQLSNVSTSVWEIME